MSVKKNKYKPPQKNVGDALHSIVKAGLSILGGPATELFNSIVTSPLERRRTEWMKNMWQGLLELEKKKNVNLEELQKNEIFIDAVMQASQAAMRTSRKEKLEALRNAVLNTALPNAPDEDHQSIFLNLVDTLTPWHLRILKLLMNEQWEEVRLDPTTQYMTPSFQGSVMAAFPELKEYVYDHIMKDLSSKGLADLDAIDSSHEMATTSGRPSVEITDIGNQFIIFITSPIQSSPCYLCKHINRMPRSKKCKAYPKGIPEEIWLGTIEHTKPYPDDNGIRFVKIK